MQPVAKESQTLWQDLFESTREYPSLQHEINADVCIIGAGITGLTAAYLLAKSGKKIAIIDAWGVAAGETSRTTAHLTAVLDDRYYHLESIFGETKTRHIAESHMAAINRIEMMCKKENIACDFQRVPGFLVAKNAKQAQSLEKELASCRRLGLGNVEMHSSILSPMKEVYAALCFPDQASFNIAKYIQGLLAVLQDLKVTIYTGSAVQDIQEDDPWHVILENKARINATEVIVAAHTPFNDRFKIHTKQAAYRSYVLAYEIPKESYPSCLIWDLEEPYHYIRRVAGGNTDFLLIGGEDHKTGQCDNPEQRFENLKKWSKQHFNHLGELRYQWSGQIIEPVDGLAFIGKNPDSDNLYMATGFSGNGMTYGTMAGILIHDLIQGVANPWEEIYQPSRKTLKTAGQFLDENLNAVSCMVKDWVKPCVVKSEDKIPRGEGAIMQDGLNKVAVYRDEQGDIQKFSAKCPHLGCVVQWNGGEKTWDCPCHGSRFTAQGKVINGPAASDLTPKN